MKVEATQHVAQAATWTQYIGSAAAGVLYFLNSNAAAIGAIVAITGLVIQWYYRRKEFQLRLKQKGGDE